MMSSDTGANKFHGHFKTTADSRLLAVIVCAINEWNSHTWVVKPEFLSEVFNNVAKVIPVAPLLKEGLQNMVHMSASDPNDPDKTRPLITEYTPRDDPKKTIVIPNYRLVTYLSIPATASGTRAEEMQWSTKTTESFLRALRDFMASNSFTQVLLQIGKARRGDYTQKLFNTRTKTNLPKFLNSAVVKATSCDKITDHLIMSECKSIFKHLYKHKVSTPKYAGEADQVDESEGDGPFAPGFSLPEPVAQEGDDQEEEGEAEAEQEEPDDAASDGDDAVEA